MENFKRFFLIAINVLILIKNHQCASGKSYGNFPIVIDQRNLTIFIEKKTIRIIKFINLLLFLKSQTI